MLTELREYQIADLAFYMANPRCGNFSEPGTGKTPPTVVYTYNEVETTGLPAVWVQPKSLIVKNQLEFLNFTPYTKHDVSPTGPKVHLLTAEKFKKFPIDSPLSLIVVDEWHMLYQKHTSQRTTHLLKYLSRNKDTKLVALTGTIVHGSLASLYPFVKAVDPYLYSSYQNFLYRHAIIDFTGNIIGWRNQDRLRQILQKYSIRRLFSDTYGPEELIFERQYVELDSRHRKLYKEFHDKAYLELSSDKIFEATTPAVHVVRARQLLAHPPLELEIEQTAKEEALSIHIEDHVVNRTPFVIFCSLIPEQERISRLLEKMKVPHGIMNGTTSANRRADIDADFRCGKIQCIVGTPATASVGFNWQCSGDKEVSHVIFNSIDYLDTNLLQARRRFSREKRKTPLRITYLIYKNTIEERILEIVEKKHQLSKTVDTDRGDIL